MGVAGQRSEPIMRAGTVPSRFELIRELALTEPWPRVLDVGCVDARPDKGASAERIASGGTLGTHLFSYLAERNPNVLGIDRDAAGIAHLVEMGFQAEVADAMDLDLGARRFDVILATELIEHVEDPGRLLRSLARHLAPGGKLLITTPNPHHSAQLSKIWRKGAPDVHEEHVLWFCPTTLARLFERVGLTWVEGVWIAPRRARLRNWRRLFRPRFNPAFGAIAIRSRTRHERRGVRLRITGGR